MQRSIPYVLVCLVALGCAGASPSTSTSLSSEEPAWSAALLSKLDAPLRSRVAHGSRGRIPIQVFFRELPSDDVLGDLMLNRLGEQAVGNVETETLRRIAARSDVDRIEELNDVGYEVQ